MQGGGTTTSNTIQKSDPWGPSQPFLTDLMAKGQQTYNAAQGHTSMPSTFNPFSPLTNAALGATAQRAMSGSPLTSASENSLTNLLNNGGAPSPGDTALSLIANGGNVNPYLNSMFNAAAAPVSDAVMAQFSGGGRTGSVANQQALARNLGDLSANIFGQGFSNAQSNAITAANALNASAANRGQQVVQGAAMAPNVSGQDYTNLQNLLNVGGAYDAQNQNLLNSNLQQWQYAQQQPWNILSGYAGAISGLGNLGGTSSGTSTNTQPQQSMLPSLIGAGLSAAPLFMMSDMRLKRDTRRIGTTPNGLGLYAYKFNGSDIPCIGLMAQEVMAKAPKAVREQDGYMAVDYTSALAA